MNLFNDAAGKELRPIAEILGGAPRPFAPSLADTLRDALARIDTTPQTIEAADRAQQQLLAILDAHQHRAAVFLKVYHGITVAVMAALDAGRLQPKFFFERLAGRFAERHFDGLKADLGDGAISDAATYQLWRPSFALDNLDPATALLGDKPALIHFTVGMCCHINLDLAAALDETIRELHLEGEPGQLEAIERGHNFVDAILAEEVGRSTALLAEEYGCPMSKRIIETGEVGRVGEQSMVTIRRWRGKTFPYALRLCTAPSDEARKALRAEIYRAGARKTVQLFNALPIMVQTILGNSS